MEIRETRRRNLAVLVQDAGSQAALAQQVGTDAAYISQLTTGWRDRAMGDDLARQIEAATGKTRGWMDTQHPELWSGEMAKAAGRPLIQTSHKAAQLTWLEQEQALLSESSLGTLMAVVEQLRKLERPAEPPDSTKASP